MGAPRRPGRCCEACDPLWWCPFLGKENSFEQDNATTCLAWGKGAESLQVWGSFRAYYWQQRNSQEPGLSSLGPMDLGSLAKCPALSLLGGPEVPFPPSTPSAFSTVLGSEGPTGLALAPSYLSSHQHRQQTTAPQGCFLLLWVQRKL